MARRRSCYVLIFCLFVWICATSSAVASEFHGQVTFGGLPLPGATVTVTQGTTKTSTVSDQGGIFNFADLPDGPSKIEIEMQCFSTIQDEVIIAPHTPPGKWELILLPLDQLLARTKVEVVQPALPSNPNPVNSARKTSEASNSTPPAMPKSQEDATQQSADSLLVNGSVNNAATSQYSLDPAFGNRRPGSKGIYTGGLSVNLGNSAFDARPYSLSGFNASKPTYNHATGALMFGGPLRIPHLLPHGPNFFLGYQWMRNSSAATLPGLVPTAAERTGDLSGLVDADGKPIAIFNPNTGQPFSGNIVPVTPQAQAMLRLFPLPNINGSYNYQTAVLNSTHQDTLESRMEKSLGRRDQLYGGIVTQSTRASSANLFGFVDTTDTLGINTNINWSHRFSRRLSVLAGYRFSRLRMLSMSNFEKRQNISGLAGISGNDQDPADWGPPTLNFSSGFAPLADAQSSFNRNRTDAFSLSAAIYHGHHSVTIGADLRKQQFNDFFQQDPRGTFTFTGTATKGAGTTTGGSDLADFLLGVPDTSSIAFGNADKYLRQSVYDAYASDDWHVLSILTVTTGVRWEYGAPITETHGRLVNLDVTPNFSAAAPVLGSDPIGPLTGSHYPASLVRPDRLGVEPRIGISWRPIPASSVVVRAGYGVYHDTSVYLRSVLQLAQQAPLSKSLSVQNSATCPLTLANGFTPCSSVTADTFALDPNFRVGYAQTWQLSVQRDLPAALQLTATYLGIKGTRGVQQFLPNTYPIGEANPCTSCSSGFVYQTSGGDSTRQSGQLQLRRRLRSGLTASLLYTYSKSIDDDAMLGGQGGISANSQGQVSTQVAAAVAQNWLDLHAERARSNFDQRHLLNLQAQYTSGEGLGGGTLLGGWRGAMLKEWTITTQITTGSGLPETPIYMAAVPGSGFSGTIRPSLTGAPLYTSAAGTHLNATAYAAPANGQWGTAARNSIDGPGQFSLDTSLARTFRPSTRYYLDARIDATNVLNHVVFTNWNATLNSTQFGLPNAANAMRSLQTTLRLRF